MPQDPRNQRPGTGMSAEEYRRRQAAKEQKRKQRRQRQLLLLGGFALAIVILVVVIVLIIKAAFGKKDETSAPPTSGVGTSEVGGTNWPTAPDKNAWNLWLINEQNLVAADFDRPEMVQVTEVGYWFDARMVDEMNRMIADCNAQEGHSLQIYSGFRSYERQEEMFEGYVNGFRGQGMSDADAYTEAKRLTDYPGASDHHTGLSVDFITDSIQEPSAAFAETSEYAWLMENAASYGFILRYPGDKVAITGIEYRPYQWRYVGADDARTIRDAGICLEEYLAVLPSPGEGTDAPESATEPDSTPE